MTTRLRVRLCNIGPHRPRFRFPSSVLIHTVPWACLPWSAISWLEGHDRSVRPSATRLVLGVGGSIYFHLSPTLRLFPSLQRNIDCVARLILVQPSVHPYHDLVLGPSRMRLPPDVLSGPSYPEQNPNHLRLQEDIGTRAGIGFRRINRAPPDPAERGPGHHTPGSPIQSRVPDPRTRLEPTRPGRGPDRGSSTKQTPSGS